MSPLNQPSDTDSVFAIFKQKLGNNTTENIEQTFDLAKSVLIFSLNESLICFCCTLGKYGLMSTLFSLTIPQG